MFHAIAWCLLSWLLASHWSFCCAGHRGQVCCCANMFHAIAWCLLSWLLASHWSFCCVGHRGQVCHCANMFHAIAWCLLSWLLASHWSFCCVGHRGQVCRCGSCMLFSGDGLMTVRQLGCPGVCTLASSHSTRLSEVLSCALFTCVETNGQ